MVTRARAMAGAMAQSIQAGDNPRFIEEKLTNLIPGIMAKKMGGGGGGKEKKGK